MATKQQLQTQIDILEMEILILKDEIQRSNETIEDYKGKICINQKWYDELIDSKNKSESLEQNNKDLKLELISRLTLISDQSETINKLISKFVTFNQ